MVNKLRGVLNVCAVKAPGFGDRRKAMLEDIAVLTGARFISEDLGEKLESVELDALGTAKTVTIDKENTTLIEGAGKKDAITSRINQIGGPGRRPDLGLRRREAPGAARAKLGGVAVINCRAATEPEMK